MEKASTEACHFLCFLALYFIALFGFYAIAPISALAFFDSEYIVSLFYFPHAANTIGVWLYGWRVLIYMIPIAIGWYTPFRPEDAGYIAIIALVNSLLAQAIYFRAILPLFRLGAAQRPWVRMFTVGCVASAINLTVANVLFDFNGVSDRLVSSVFLVTGQVSGLIAGMSALMLIFKLSRRFFPAKIDH